MTVFLGIVALSFIALFVFLWRRQITLRRAEYIRSFELPRGLYDQLRKRRPTLTFKECHLTSQALRQFFLAYAMSGRQLVSMPSQAADDLWHEFILYTRHYHDFCQKAFGGFLHHTPAVVLGKGQQGNAGLRRCWWQTCRIENINPRNPTRLPLLFALDAKLKIEDGFRYVADCQSVRRQGDNNSSAMVYCGGDFGDSNIDGGLDGWGDSTSDSSSDGGGDSSGCGGGGCSGS
ncbi:MAG: hypothetical protein JNM52_07505 [Betaproteobacteria bacterium]|nr:hypothetical protein [Betaproteobacteria bacterium]